MSPERRNPTNQLSETEWGELVQRLPVLFELAESYMYVHRSDEAVTAVCSIGYSDDRGQDFDHYYVYRVNPDRGPLTMYSINPASREIWVDSDVDFGRLADFDNLMNDLQFSEITGMNCANAQNLMGLRKFLSELREQDELFGHMFDDNA
jgi:hypothetical protein